MVKNKGEILMDEEEITIRWKEYLENLYEGNNEATRNYTGIKEMYLSH